MDVQEIQALKVEIAQLADAPRLRYSSSWQASQGEKDLSTVAKGILLILERLGQIQGTDQTT
jgi:hypothetical protein